MKKFLLAIALAVVGTTVSSAVPVCLGFMFSQSCTVGTVTFSNFTVANVNDNNQSTNNHGGTVTSIATDMRYDIDVTGSVYTVRFYAGGSQFGPANQIRQNTGEQTSFNTQYRVTSGVLFNSVSAAQVSSTTGGTASNQLAKTLCSIAPDPATGACLGVQYTNPSLSTTDIVPTNGPVAFGPISNFWVNDNVQVAGGSSTMPAANGMATLTSYSNIFTTTVPEPMTMSLMGLGLLAVGFVGHRLKK